MNIQKFIKLKTDYKNIAISTIILFALLFLLLVIGIFVFWEIYGEDASADRISELWYVEIILDYLPIAIISKYLVFKAFKNYKKQKYIESKTSIMSLVIVILLFLIRNEILQILF